MEASKGIEQAEVMRRWHEQQVLPESERDILEYRLRPDGEWIPLPTPGWNFSFYEFRLRKRPRQKKVTVYLYRQGNCVYTTVSQQETKTPIGQADITYEEPDDDA